MNLSLMPVDCERMIREVLLSLVDGPLLATSMPKLSNALIAAEQRGYCRAQCLERVTNSSRSIWQWTITPSGQQWLHGPSPTPKRATRKRPNNRHKAYCGGRIGEFVPQNMYGARRDESAACAVTTCDAKATNDMRSRLFGL